MYMRMCTRACTYMLTHMRACMAVCLYMCMCVAWEWHLPAIHTRLRVESLLMPRLPLLHLVRGCVIRLRPKLVVRAATQPYGSVEVVVLVTKWEHTVQKVVDLVGKGENIGD